MLDGPIEPAKAMVSVWELESTECTCDYCPRSAKYAVYIAGKDDYLCIRHTITALKDQVMAIERAVFVG